MEDWYEDRPYQDFEENIRDHWPFLKQDVTYWRHYMPNVTRLTSPFYDYYVVDPFYGNFKGKGTTFVLIIGNCW